MANSIIKANSIIPFTPTLESNFRIAQWGWLAGWKIGKIGVVSGSGISCTDELTSDTLMMSIPYQIKSAEITSCYIDSTHNAKIRTQVNSNTFYVNGVAANANFYFQIVFAIS